MYDAKVFAKIRKLLKQGFSQRWIARHVGVCQSTVSAISKGKRLDTHGNKGKAHAGRTNKQVEYCPHHRKVRLPCVACAAEQYRRLHPEIDWSQSDPLPNDDERIRRLVVEQWQIVNEVDDKITQGYE